MKMAWAVAIVLLIIGFLIFFEALTTRGLWLSIPLLLLSGVFTGPGIIALLALLGLYDLAIEINGRRLEFRKLGEDRPL
jgi:hypothetical protein